MATASGTEDGKRALARQARQQVEQTKARIVELMTEVARKNNQISFIERQQQDIAGHLQRLEEQTAEGAGEIKQAEAAVADAEAALSMASEARAKVAEQLRVTQEGLVEARSKAGEARAAFEKLESQRRRVEARHESLGRLLSGMEGYSGGVRKMVKRLKDEPAVGFRGTVAELLESPEELEASVELALGERLQGVVVDDLDAHRVVEVSEKLICFLPLTYSLAPTDPPFSPKTVVDQHYN